MNLNKLLTMQGVYYYFYQLLRNEAEDRAQKSKKLGHGDGTVGMLTSLVVASLAGYKFLLLLLLQVVTSGSCFKNFDFSRPARDLYCFHIHVWKCCNHSLLH